MKSLARKAAAPKNNVIAFPQTSYFQLATEHVLTHNPSVYLLEIPGGYEFRDDQDRTVAYLLKVPGVNYGNENN